MTKPFAENKDLKEIVSKRTYTQKVYDNSPQGKPGSKQYHISTRHVHYKNNLGKFEDINTTLLFDNSKKTWNQSRASYHCEIPERADGWITFYNAFEGVNNSIRTRPLALHVEGEQTTGQDAKENCIIYKDAFDKGIDLRIYAGQHSLREIICINSKPVNISKDLHFDFEIDLQNADVINKKTGVKWSKEGFLNFKNKQLKIGSNNKYSYFTEARIWDSIREINEPIKIELYEASGKIYLRKTITKEILESAVYPLYTDHPTDYHAHAGDCEIYGPYINNWDTAHDGAGTGIFDFGNYASGSRKSGTGKYQIKRVAQAYDTSGIGSGANVTSAALKIYAALNDNGDPDGNNWLTVVLATLIDPEAPAAADFVNIGDSIDNPTEGGNRITIGTFPTDAYSTFTLIEAAYSWINKTGYTTLGIREGHDCVDHAIAGSGTASSLTMWAASDATRFPTLVVTAEAGGNPFPVNRLDKKAISGYHCFMGGYLSAKVETLDPLKLPDGTIF